MKKSLFVATVCALTTFTLQAAPTAEGDAEAKKPAKAKKDGDAKKPAKGKKGGPEVMFKKMDTDGNGSLSVEEFTTGRLATMKKALGKAGKTEAEITEATAKRTKGLPKMFAKIDANDDGAVTIEELKNAPKKTPKKAK